MRKAFLLSHIWRTSQQKRSFSSFLNTYHAPKKLGFGLLGLAGIVTTSYILLPRRSESKDLKMKSLPKKSKNISIGKESVKQEFKDTGSNLKSVNVNLYLVDKRKYKRGEVATHNSSEKGIWVTYENGVYDITEFVAIHPGGEKILLAAGKAIDPFWSIFSIHASKETRELLESYRIGDLVPIDQDETARDIKSTGLELLFANEPARDPSLIVHSSRPCNAESDIDSLKPFITANEKFYVRNHLPVPMIEEDSFKLEIEG